MVIYLTADIHGHLPDVPADCDLLCIAGDICPSIGSHHPSVQCDWLNSTFSDWCKQLRCQVVITAGNHDFVFDSEFRQDVNLPSNVHVLIDESIVINDITYYGFPWTPNLRNWAFYGSSDTLCSKAELLPKDVDILLCHAPPNIINEMIDVSIDHTNDLSRPRHFGSNIITDMILVKTPKYVVCGHIHSGDHRPIKLGKSTVFNVAMMSEDYFPKYPMYKLT